jgi:hypothetical protein
MTIEELILILRNRLDHNARMREQAVIRGDADAVNQFDADSATTQNSLDVLLASAGS